MNTRYPVAVIGGGQAGLSVSYCLKEQGIDHIVFEKSRFAEAWRTQRWDTFCLVTPNWQCQLPGFPYAGPDPNGFMVRDEIVGYIEAYVKSFNPPLLEGVSVKRLARKAGGGFAITTSIGEFFAEQVVVAIGGYHSPRVPRIAERFDPSITHVHSSAYKNPDALPPGAVMVVGTGQSGCQIAEDLHLAGRTVHLSTGSAPRTARRYRGRDVVDWLHDMGYYDLPVTEHPKKEGVRAKANHYVTGRDGGRDIDLRKFASEGMQLHGRMIDMKEGKLIFADDLKTNLDQADAVAEKIKDTIDEYIAKQNLNVPTDPRYKPVWEPPADTPLKLDYRAAGITSIIWSVGFGTDYTWIELPLFDGRGYPAHQRGVTAIPGIYFLGLPWLHTWGSGRFSGIARDARYLADCIAAKTQFDTLPAQDRVAEWALGS
jgi:putative flavoprotein involved in K+ transport